MLSTSGSRQVSFKVHLGPCPNHALENGVKVDVRNVNFWYGEKQVLRDVNIAIADREVTAFIGPSGCGKTTLLRCLNRTNDEIRGARMSGTILLDGQDINDERLDPPLIRRRFGWVAQKPNPFPSSIYSNIAYGPQIHGLVKNKAQTDRLVEESLLKAGLWREVKDRLQDSGIDLSVGQQQRLCVARALATDPEVLLMDEPASALDPVATAHIEELIEELRDKYAIVIITHNMQQAARVSQRVAVFHTGELVEHGDTEQIFFNPRHKATKAYLSGQFG